MRNLSILLSVLVSLAVYLCGCGGVTYPDEKVVESIENILYEEYSIEDVNVSRDENSIWLHLYTESIFNENMQLDEEIQKLVHSAFFSSSRVLFSSDAEIDFISLYVCARNGMELRMVRHIEDVKKANFMYISRDDFQARSDVSTSYNPVVFGKNAVLSMAGASSEEIKKNIVVERRSDLTDRIPRFDEVTELKGLRIGDDSAIVYVETQPGDNQSLFLIDTEFEQDFTTLMILLQSAGGSAAMDEYAFPVIERYWDLAEGFPQEYKEYGDPSGWERGGFYTRPVAVEDFVAAQIERNVKEKFAKKMANWGINIKEIEVIYSDNTMHVMRDKETVPDARYEVDADYEIALTVSDVLEKYDADVEKIALYDRLWNFKGELSRSRLDALTEKNWERIDSSDEFSIINYLMSIFIPGFSES